MASDPPLRVALLTGTSRFLGTFRTEQTLWDALESFEKRHEVNLTRAFGVPPPEENSLMRVQYNVKGYMQPVVTTKDGKERFDSNEELKATQLQQLCQSERGETLILHLTLQYTPPKLDDEVAKAMIDRLKAQIFSSSSRSTETLRKKVKTTTASKKPEQGACEDSAAVETKKRLPAHRFRRVLGLEGASIPKKERKEGNSGTSSMDVESSTDTNMIDKRDFDGYLRGLRGERQKSSKRFTEYETTNIRFKFPGRLFVEAKFLPDETVEDLVQFLSSCFANKDMPFTLFLTPPRRILAENGSVKEGCNSTLRSLRLLPSALVHFSSPHIDARTGRRVVSGSGQNSFPSEDDRGWFLSLKSFAS